MADFVGAVADDRHEPGKSLRSSSGGAETSRPLACSTTRASRSCRSADGRCQQYPLSSSGRTRATRLWLPGQTMGILLETRTTSRPLTGIRPRFIRNGLLGTVVEVTVDADPGAAGRVASSVFREIERLQRIFNWYDPESELQRCARGETEPGLELAEVDALAETWRVRSGGAFNAAAGALVKLWDEAARAGRVPTAVDIAKTLELMTGKDSRRYNLNAIAKGWIVDRAGRSIFPRANVAGLTVNAGGDLLHLGSGPITVGIENPKRPYDNVPPLLRVAISDMALATSGGSRRGWTINGEKYSHVVDPRSGRPQRHIASASVIAPDVATADAMATILTVLEVEEGLGMSEIFEVGACIVDATGTVHRNELWRHSELAVAAAAESGHNAPRSHVPLRIAL